MNALTSIHVGMSEWAVSADPATVFIVPGLGSCIGVAIFDKARKIGGMSHVMLPDSSAARESLKPGKYADTAIPLLLAELEKLGAHRHDLAAKMAGGAQMFSAKGNLNIGERNAVAVQEVLRKVGLPLVASQTGGTAGRTVRFHLETCQMSVRSLGKSEVEI